MRTLGPIRRVALVTAVTLLAAATAGAAEVRVQAELVSAVRNVQAGTPFCGTHAGRCILTCGTLHPMTLGGWPTPPTSPQSTTP